MLKTSMYLCDSSCVALLTKMISANSQKMVSPVKTHVFSFVQLLINKKG